MMKDAEKKLLIFPKNRMIQAFDFLTIAGLKRKQRVLCGRGGQARAYCGAAEPTAADRRDSRAFSEPRTSSPPLGLLAKRGKPVLKDWEIAH